MLYPISLYSADPAPANDTDIILDDVSGGLATTLPSYKLDKKFSPYMRNVIVDNGKLEKPNGFIQIGSSMVLRNVQGIFPYYDDNGVVSYYVTDSSIVLRTSDFNFYTFVSSGHNTGVLMRGVQARSKMFFSNGIDSVFEHDPTNGKVILNGTNGTPNVPKGKYQIYYLERLWEANLPNNPSQACYSDVKSTNGAAIALDNFLAWPVGNCVSIGLGDGQVITGVWIENSQLQFGKERSIYTLFGTNAGSFAPRKSADVGVASHDSIVMMDNQAHFVGQDGIYRDTTRISDGIKPENESINRDSTRVLQNSWDSKSDFLRGNFSGSTVTPEGIVTVNNQRYQVNFDTYPNGGSLPKSSSFTFPTGTTSTGYAYFASTNPVPENLLGYISVDTVFAPISVKMWARSVSPDGCSTQSQDAYDITAELKNTRTGTTSSYTSNVSVICSNFALVQIYAKSVQEPVFSAEDVKTGSMTIKLTVTSTQNNFPLTVFPTTGTGFADIYLIPSSTVQYVSDIATMTSVTAWGNIDSLRNTNGGNILFYERTSTSVVNIATKTWSQINPGVTINEPTINNYIQWAATITSIATSAPAASNIDYVTIDHIEGAGAINRAFGINWKNRYWCFVSTSSDPNLSLLLMKSRTTNTNPDAWMPQEGINIRAIAKDNANTLYGGSSSTGVFYRLDYGTNYNGMPINSIYRTPEQFFGNPFMEKSLFEYYLTADKQAGKTLGINLYVNGTLKNSGSYSLDGTGRMNRVIQNVIGKGKLFQWEFTNNQLDEGLDVTNFGVNYQMMGSRKGANE